MKRKLRLRSIVAVLLAFALAFVGVNPVGVEVYAEELTSITWSDFNLTVGNTYTGATDESSAGSNAGSYSGAANMNNIEFVGDVIMANGTEMRYGGNNFNQGFKIQVVDDAFVLTSGQTYIYAGNQSGENEYELPENGTITVKIPKSRAAAYGLNSFAGEQFTLKIKMSEWDGNTGWSGMKLSVWINDVVVEENLSVASGSFGTYFCACVYGSVTPALKLNKLSWEDFGFTVGKTYAGATDESSAPSNAGTYSAATNMNNTVFVGDVIMANDSEMRYGGNNYNQGFRMQVVDDAFVLTSGQTYIYPGNQSGSNEYVNESNGTLTVKVPKTRASEYGLKSFANEQFTLRIQMTGWDGNTGFSGMSLSVWINDVVVEENLSVASGSFGTYFCACVYGSVTIPEPERQFTVISWADFDGAVYGQTYDKTDVLLTYKGSNLNDTAFEDDIIFQPGASLLYAVQNSWHGLEIGVTTAGELKVHGSSYSDGFNALSYTYPASQFGLVTLANAKITLRVEMWNVTAKTADVQVYINEIQAGNKITLTKADVDAVAGIGTGIAPCPFGGTLPFTIPGQPLTEISWTDFDSAEYGRTYNVESWLTYTGESLNNTAFEDVISFSSGASMTYGTSGAWHGLRIGVNANDQLFVRGDCYTDGGTGFNNAYDASTFGLSTLTDTLVTLRIEMRDVTESTANVKIYVNGIQAGNAIALTRDPSNDAHAYLGKVAAFCVGDTNSVTIPKDVTLSDLYHNLSEGAYVVPDGIVELSEKAIKDGVEEWSVLATNAGDTLNTVGDYKVISTDGKLNYTQEVILYASGTSDLKTFMRTLKHVQGVQDAVYEKADVRMCDVNNNNEIEQEDENIIRKILLGLFS